MKYYIIQHDFTLYLCFIKCCEQYLFIILSTYYLIYILNIDDKPFK